MDRMDIKIRELEEMTSDKTSISDFLTALEDARNNKEHISIDVVTLKDGTNFTAVINGVNPDDIKYIEKTGCIHVGGWKDCYSLVVPDKSNIYMSDATPQNWQGMMLQYSFWKDDLSVAFLFSYDETIMEEYI